MLTLFLACMGMAAVALLLSPAVVDPGWQREFEKPGYLRSFQEKAQQGSPLFARVLPLIQYFGWMASLLGIPRDKRSLANDLGLANYPGGFLPQEFVGVSMVYGLGAGAGWYLMMMAYWIGDPAGMERPGLLVPAFLAVVVMGYVRFIWLSDAVNRQQTHLTESLPHLLDLISLGMEAGLTFESALRRLVDSGIEKREPLVLEFRNMLNQFDAGKSRIEVFEAVRQRYPSGPFSLLMTAFIQGQSTGVNYVSILRMQSAMLRTARSQLATKMANELPVKMMLPMACVLISVLLTIFGGIMVRMFSGDLFGG